MMNVEKVNPVVKITIDNNAIEEEITKEIKQRIEEQTQKLFYDMADLVAITSFSKGHIMNTFFYDKRFEKIRKKVGKKHVFPAKETNEFLLTWIQEQPAD